MPSPNLNPPPAGMTQDVIDFRTRSSMPDEDVDDLWTQRTGFLEALAAGAIAEIESRLKKRYVTPFDAAGVTNGTNPRPEIVVRWMTQIMTPEAYLARGYNPQDQALETANAMRTEARDAIKEAADAKDGLYDLPLRVDAATGGIIGAPLAYSESSPYTWTDVQENALYGGYGCTFPYSPGGSK